MLSRLATVFYWLGNAIAGLAGIGVLYLYFENQHQETGIAILILSIIGIGSALMGKLVLNVVRR